MLAGCAVFVASAGAYGITPEEELAEDHSLATRFVTPHTAWAKGYAQGRVSACFIVNAGPDGGSYIEPGTRLREVVELRQRFDIDGDAVFVGPQGNFYQSEAGEERARRLLEKEYDVYVFGNVSLEVFRPELQYKILERVVKQGAGLVCCGPRPEKIFTPQRALKPTPPSLYEGVPLARIAALAGLATDPTDEQAAERLVTGYQLGEGRGVSLNYSAHTLAPYLPFRFRALTEYDYWMLLVGRAVLWASGREPQVRLRVTPGPTSIPLDQWTGQPVHVTLSNPSRQPVRLQLTAALRRGDGVRAPLPNKETPVGARESVDIPLALPMVRADDYFLDVMARSERGVEAFGAGAVTVTSTEGLEKIAVDAPFVERGESIGVNVTLRGESFGDRDTLRVQLRDSFDRVLCRREMPVSADTTDYTCRFEVGDWATILMRAEAALVRQGREIELKEASFRVPKRRQGQFNFVQWAARNDVLEYYAWQKLGEAGWKVSMALSDALAACDVSVIPYSTRILETHDKEGFMQPVCWNDEPKVDEYVHQIVQGQAGYRQHGTFVYSLGDEGTTKGCCVHPACLVAYRRYLQQQYDTIDRLNASWGSEYRSFEEVDLLDRKDVMEGRAVGQGLFARWYDRQAFARYNLAQFTHRFVEAFKKLDPQAVTGFEGTGGFGDDFDAILKANTFWSPYPSIGDDILRSVAPRQFIRANWMGYHKNADPLINYSWRMVMKEMDSIWWWRYDGAGSWRGYVSPTLDFWPATQQLCDEMRVVREGLGDALLHSQVRHSGIAVFYSLPSALARQLGDSSSFPDPEQDHQNWLRATYDLGLDVRYVTSGKLKSGVLDSGEFKLLLLPMTQAIGPEEAAAVRRFVEQGGVLVADLRPGVFDDHCKPLEKGALDDLLGIQRTGTGPAEKAPLDIRVSLGGQTVPLRAGETTTDPFVAPARAQPLAQAGRTPVVLVNTVGQGQTVLLNFALPPQQGEAQGFSLETYRFLRALYGLAGVKAPVSATDPWGQALPNVETRVWENGEMMIFGLWYEMDVKFFGEDATAQPGARRQAKIVLPESRYVYDLRRGKSLGRVHQVRTALLVGRANFFAALPVPLAGVKLRAASATPERGERLDVEISLNLPVPTRATHVVHVEVIDPNGKTAPWGQQVVLLPHGKGQVSVPIAWNDAPGRWRLRATELFSRRTGEVSWTVK